MAGEHIRLFWQRQYVFPYCKKKGVELRSFQDKYQPFPDREQREQLLHSLEVVNATEEAVDPLFPPLKWEDWGNKFPLPEEQLLNPTKDIIMYRTAENNVHSYDSTSINWQSATIFWAACSTITSP